MKHAIVKAFTGQKPIVIYPVYLDITGDYATAAALGQVLYWHEVMRGKFYKTDADFEQELHLTHRQFKRVKTALKTLSFLKITLEQVPAKTFWDVDYEALTALIESIASNKEPPTGQYQNVPTGQYQNVPTGQYQNVPTGQYQNVPTITENTTEITRNNNNNAPASQVAAHEPVVVKTPNTDKIALVGLTERQKGKVQAQLSELSQDQQKIAIDSFNQKIAKGGMIQEPVVYLNGLINLGREGALTAPREAKTIQAVQTTVTAPKTDLELISAYVSRYTDRCLKMWREGFYVHVPSVGNVTDKNTLILAGLPIR